jgi:sugar phosphate isomerase/epimerase
MDKYSIAAQLYTLRDYLKTPDQIFETLKRVKDIGYQAVQVSGMGPIDPLQLKKMVDEIGLKICVTHIPYDRLKNDLEAVIKEHKLWECEYVGLGAMPQQFKSSRKGYLEFLTEVTIIAKKISESGLKFVYHNHKFEFEKFDGISGIEILFNKTDPKTFGFELDTYWLQAGGANPIDWIKKVEGRMDVVHLKDMAIRDDQQIFAEIGEGNLDWTSIIQACRETGVKWYAVEQDVCQCNPFDSLSMSLRYLEKFL